MRNAEFKRMGLAACVALVLGTATCVLCARPRREKRPNVLLILVDTLRADHLGCYGYTRKTSPNLDRFAQRSMLFETCFSHAPETGPSCAALHSGFLPHETKVLCNGRMPGNIETLAERLRKHGYRTAAVVCNYVLRRGEGYEQGFEIYDDTMNERECVRQLTERVARPATDRAMALLAQFKDEPFFMWIHYQDPHGPYTPPGEYSGMFVDSALKPKALRVNGNESGRGGIPSYQQLGKHRDFHYYVSQYDGEIRYWDGQFGRLLEAVTKLGLYDRTLIVFSADHGEGMGEHDLYFSHGENLHTSMTHVPLIIRYGRRLRGRRGEFVQHNDLVPTILKALGLPMDPRLGGRDLRAGRLEETDIVAAMRGQRWSIIRSGMKLICHGAPGSGHRELFDLRKDLGEKSNLAGRPERRRQIDELARALKTILRTDRLKVAPPPARRLTDEEKRKLKSLGYAH